MTVGRGLTVTVITSVVAHCPAFGVNVYVVVVVVLMAGYQAPVIGIVFVELVGKLRGSPTQIGVIAVNVGVTGGTTLTVITVVVAHCPAFGIKVYAVVEVLLIAGDQVPVIGVVFVELVGKLKGSPTQIGVIAVKVGTVEVVIVKLRVSV